jgi:hypothetical protein
VTKQEWIDQVSRGLSKTMPDMYPSGYAAYLAEQYAEEGGYEKYLAGGYSADHLWEPEHA